MLYVLEGETREAKLSKRKQDTISFFDIRPTAWSVLVGIYNRGKLAAVLAGVRGGHMWGGCAVY